MAGVPKAGGGISDSSASTGAVLMAIPASNALLAPTSVEGSSEMAISSISVNGSSSTGEAVLKENTSGAVTMIGTTAKDKISTT